MAGSVIPNPPGLPRPRRPRRTPRAPGIGLPPSIRSTAGSGVAPPPTPGPPRPAAPAGPTLAQQAQAQVSAQLDPMLQYITNRYNQQAQGVTGALRGLTGSYVSELGRLAGNIPGIYEPARQTVSAAAQGVNRQLTQAGQAQQAAQAASAAQAGLPTGGMSPDINVAAAGAGAGGAAGAIGDAAINALAQAQKAAMTYAGKLPGFAALEGDQQLKSALVTLSGQMADQLAQTTAQAPQLFWTIYQSLADRAQHDKEFKEQVREWKVGQRQRQQQIDQAAAQRRAGIAGPNAPTVAGRQAYWDKVAQDRTQQTGVMYVGTSSGIRPVDVDPKKPGIQMGVTLQGQAAQASLGKPITASTPRGRIQYNPQTGGWDLIPGTGPTPKKPSLIRYTDGSGRTRLYDPATGKSTVLPGPPKPPKQPTNTGPYYIDPRTHQPVLAPGYEIKDGRVVKATNPNSAGKVTGSAPIRVSPGHWRTRGGKNLLPLGNAYWERMWREGRTDGHGSWKPPKKKTGTDSSKSGL